jgi:hypothetical protein
MYRGMSGLTLSVVSVKFIVMDCVLSVFCCMSVYTMGFARAYSKEWQDFTCKNYVDHLSCRKHLTICEWMFKLEKGVEKSVCI